MKSRNTIISLILLIALGAYVYYYERTPIEETATGERKVIVLSKFEPFKVSEFSIAGTDTTQTILCTRNKDSSWNMNSPVRAQADKLEIETYLSDFKDLKSDRVLKDNLQVLSTYGLGTPKQIISLKTGTKSGEMRLLIGSQNPDGNSVYVKKENDSSIYLIPSAQVNRWNKSSYDFRDKSIAEFTTEDVNQLTLSYPNPTWVFKKENEEWKMTQPTSLDMDKYKVEDLFWKIHSAQIKQFVDESPRDLKPYGLDKPDVITEIKTNMGKVLSISFSRQGPTPELIYAKTSDKAFVFAIETSIVQALKITNIDSFRNRSLFSFNVDNIQSIQLISTTTLTLLKEKEDWYITTPKKVKVDDSKIQDILWKINGLHITNFIEDHPKDLTRYGLKNPSVKVLLTDSHKKIYTLLVGNLTNTKDSAYIKTDTQSNIYSTDTEIIFLAKLTDRDLITSDAMQGQKK